VRVQPFLSALERTQAAARPSSALSVRRQTAQNAASPASRPQHGELGVGGGDQTLRHRTLQLDHLLMSS